MEVTLELRVWEGEEWRSLGLDFYLTGRQNTLKLPTERRRRDVALHLLSGIKWQLEDKIRTLVRFKGEMSEDCWKAFEILCEAKYRLTKNLYVKWMAISPAELVEELKIIGFASAFEEG